MESTGRGARSKETSELRKSIEFNALTFWGKADIAPALRNVRQDPNRHRFGVGHFGLHDPE
jgi:hypothetical protein